MSIQATIDIYFNEGKRVKHSQILDIFLASDWKNMDNNKFRMLPLGDEDYSWISYTEDEKEAKVLLNSKLDAGEVGGIELFYNKSGIGIEMLLFTDSQLSISLSINRKTKFKSHTDIDWYIEKILLPLEQQIEIESFEFVEQL
ncbi:hypothetical protein [Enterococcus larvae]|uniref:hypothetical protein n=1 Tax=Enterococcus larvae TaxID=2794352 RepID=UPI003F38F8B6